MTYKMNEPKLYNFLVARAVPRGNFVKIYQIHCSTHIFVPLTLFSIKFSTYVKIKFKNLKMASFNVTVRFEKHMHSGQLEA